MSTLTLQEIQYSMKKLGRDTKRYPVLPIIRGTIETIAMFGMNSLTFKALVKSESKAGQKYQVMIKFHNVKYHDAKGTTQEMIKQGKLVRYFEKPDCRKNPVSIKCSCMDFEKRAEIELFQRDALIGNWTKYKPKIDPRVWPGRTKLFDVRGQVGGQYKRLTPNPGTTDYFDMISVEGKRTKKYIKGRPYANPAFVPIICKHIYSVIYALSNSKNPRIVGFL